MTREHREAASWEEVMQEVRLWTCPAGTAVPPFPQVEDPPMQVQLPDPRWTDAWRAASFQLRGKHMWGGLAFEVGRVAHEMDLVGLHDEADKVYEHFLKAPGAKSDGDYADGNGALEWATAMRHDMGYSHDGTHASTGRLLFAMAERYFLTGDKEWFQRNRVRLQAAADWIIRQRTLYMKDIPNRQDLFVAGLMPPCMLGDYAMPSCDWHWYYVDNALSLQGLQRFADALTEFDPEAGRKYRDEAEAFRKDIRRAVDREAALAPVRLGRDGTYHSYHSENGVCPGPDGSGVGGSPVSGLRSFHGGTAAGRTIRRTGCQRRPHGRYPERDGGDGNIRQRRAGTGRSAEEEGPSHGRCLVLALLCRSCPRPRTTPTSTCCRTMCRISCDSG